MEKRGLQGQIRLDSLAYGGEAVGRIEGKAVFVPFGAPGDRASVQITEDHGRFARARLLSIEEPSPSRRSPRCRYFERCGGCTWQHVTYPAQLAAKEDAVREALSRIGGLSATVRPIIPSPLEFGYRTRTRIQLGANGAVGYFAASSDAVVDVDSCPILEPALDAELSRLRESLRSGVKPAVGLQQLELELDDQGAILRAWRAAGSREGGGLGFRQANRAVNDALRALVCEQAFAAAAAPRRGPPRRAARGATRLTVVDLYCGNGNLSIPLAARGARVVGFDSASASIDAARARARGLAAEYRCEDAAKIGGTLRSLAPEVDCLIVDPPRRGLKELAGPLAELAIPRVLYVSCSPPSLARDVRTFAARGYAVRLVQPLDMFPQSYHVESLAVLALET